MQIIGRITANAKVTTVKGDREVTNFSVAINNTYRPKRSQETVKTTTYVNCAYWINTKLAAYLTKGTLVELTGRIWASAYTDLKGESRASLNFHVDTIKLHGKSNSAAARQTEPADITEPVDDLPF